MIAELKQMMEKYQRLSRKTDYVSSHEVAGDFYRLIQEARLKRIPKNER